MTDSILRQGARQWRNELEAFISSRRAIHRPRQGLLPIEDEQRRVTGGVLIQFFEFLEKSASEALYPQLADHPLPERLFLFISDEGGLQAAKTLMDLDSEQAMAILKEEWRAFLESPGVDEDEEFIHHYQFWSVWHQNVPANWDVPPLEPGFAYWIHEEGFALADGVGRGAQHLWRWDGKELTLLKEVMSSWTN